MAARKPKPSREAEFVFRRGKRGDYELFIHIPGLSIQRSANGRTYRMADLEQIMPVLVNCDGTKRRPKMILKIYVKIPAREAELNADRRAFQASLNSDVIVV